MCGLWPAETFMMNYRAIFRNGTVQSFDVGANMSAEDDACLCVSCAALARIVGKPKVAQCFLDRAAAFDCTAQYPQRSCTNLLSIGNRVIAK